MFRAFWLKITLDRQLSALCMQLLDLTFEHLLVVSAGTWNEYLRRLLLKLQAQLW